MVDAAPAGLSVRLRDDSSFHLDRSLWLRTLRLHPRRRAARTVALLVLWQGANAAGYLLERSAGLKRSPQSCRQQD